jgi:hypothetical protein
LVDTAPSTPISQSGNCFWCWAGDEFGKDAGNFIKNGIEGLWKAFTGR